MKYCYFCGKPETSKEHVPPSHLFEGLTIHLLSMRLLKVSSCWDHNEAKSEADSAILRAMMISLDATKPQYGLLRPIDTVIARHRPHFGQEVAEGWVSRRPLVASSLPDVALPIAHLVESVNLRSWICQQAAAVLWTASGAYDPTINWATANVFSPDYCPGAGPFSKEQIIAWIEEMKRVRAAIEKFSWQPGWHSEAPKGYPPEIFRFDCIVGCGIIGFRLRYLNNFTWYVIFDASSESCQAVRAKLPTP